MAIASLCSNKPFSIKKGSSILSAIQMMKSKNVGSLVVTAKSGKRKPVGILTDRDIALCAWGSGITKSTPIDRIMSKNVVSIQANAGIAEAVDKMERKGVRRIVVQDKNEGICGVVSSDDIIQLVAREMYGIGRLVQKQTGKTAESSRSNRH